MTHALTLLYQKLYAEFSSKYGPNTCILLLVGKFYELYDYVNPTTDQPSTSILKAISIMNIALKVRPNYGPNGETGLWGGVPEQSLQKFTGVLKRENWSVVVVHQVKDADGNVVDRIVKEIQSPGMDPEGTGFERSTVASLLKKNNMYAASVLDLTTGETYSYESSQADMILHMFQVYSVKETVWLPSEGFTDESSLRSTISQTSLFHRIKETLSFDKPFVREEYFRRMFKVKGLLPIRQILGFSGEERMEKSLCYLLQFLEDHRPLDAANLTRHEIYAPGKHMRLSNNILEQLNILTRNNQRSVLTLLNGTHSAIGCRALRERVLRPITSEEELERRWGQIDWAMHELSPEKKTFLERSLKGLYDLPRLHHKLASAKLMAIDVLQMFQTYSATTCLLKNLEDTPLACEVELAERIEEFRSSVRRLLDEEKAQLRSDGAPVGFLTPIGGPRCAELEGKLEQAQELWSSSWSRFCKAAGIAEELFKLETKGTDQEFVWEGPRSTVKALEAFARSKKEKDLLQNLKLEVKKSGPITLTCQEFEVYKVSLEKLSSQLNKALAEECIPVCDDLWDEVKDFQEEWIRWLGDVDSTLALANVSKENNWVRPRLGDSLKIEGLRHPLLETAATRMEYVKNNVSLGCSPSSPGCSPSSPSGWLLYGVNASGKSSLMKAVGIACILAQAGSFVPADSMSIRPYDAAFSRIWNQDNLWAGLSSFAVEISELRDILNLATHRSLVLGDEVCSGTESLSATSLVASVIEHLDQKGAHFLFATHLHDLMKIPGFLPRPGVAVYHLKVDRTPDGKLIYDRRLQPGSGHASYGLEVALAMGIPHAILERAHSIRRGLEGEVSVREAPSSSWNTQIQRRECEVCGSRSVRDLEVHHIVPRSEGGNNTLRNLVVLCETCHDKHHAGELEIGELRQTSEGLERSTVGPGSTATATGTSSVKKGGVRKGKREFSEDELEIIRSVMEKHGNRTVPRIQLALGEHGLHLTPTQVKAFQKDL
jgi:DNA mismatch repair protein MutS